MAFLELKNITKMYEDYRALDNISLDINQGEFICFLGPSGCGKTTLLNIIAGLHFPTSGRVLFKNKEITTLSPTKRNFGVVFQNYALFPNLKVRDNITYGLRGNQWCKNSRKQRAESLLELIGLTDIAERYPNELSGGQQQRVALARAIATSPNLLLLDEPLSALDAKVRVKLRHELRELQRKLGITIIMVTHDQEEAMALSDRIVVMNQGKIEQVGTPEALYQQPATRFIADFIGSMNIVAIPEWNEGKEIAVRYEHLKVLPATEKILDESQSAIFRITHHQLMGAFYRLELLHSDQKTYLYADVPYQHYLQHNLSEQTLAAVSVPMELQCQL